MAKRSSQNDFSGWRQRVGEAIHTLTYLTNPTNDRETTWYALSVKAREGTHKLWLAIAKRYSTEGWELAFYEATTPDAALAGIIEMDLADGLKWHRDKYASQDEE